MPMIRIELIAGRTAEQKRATARAVTAAVVEHCKCPPEAVQIVFADVAKSEWAVAGRFMDEPKA